jgi:hypothetical protein
MSLALALSVKKNKRADTVVLSDISAQNLYHFGNGPSEELEDLPGIVRSILDGKKRWIVVPCSDGILRAEVIMKEFQKTYEVKLILQTMPMAGPRIGPATKPRRIPESTAKHRPRLMTHHQRRVPRGRPHLPKL